jgi:hypothetical protein
MMRNDKYIGFIILVLFLLGVTASLTLSVNFYKAESSFDENRTSTISESQIGFPGCRYGVTYGSTVDESSQLEWLDDLGAGWFSSFNTDAGGEAPNGSEFVPLIWVQQHRLAGEYLPTFSISPQLTEAGLGSLIADRRGALWIVGSEVDRGPQPGSQAPRGTFPEIYAQAYHQAYHFIKDRDPTALVAISGLVEVTPGRLSYLDLVWNSYLDRYHVPMPVDVWNMHIYILPEVNSQGQANGIASVAMGTDPAIGKKGSYDPDGSGPLSNRDTCDLEEVYCVAEHDEVTIFAQQVEAMRRWMANHGQRTKPLIMSEFSLIYPNEQDGATCWLQDEFGKCFTQDRVLEYMDDTLAFLTTARNETFGLALDDNRLVQQWLWFSIANTPSVGNISDLVAFDDQSGSLTGLTPVGDRYRAWAQTEQLFPNLLPDGLSSSIAFTSDPGGTAAAKLKVIVGNNGNIDVSVPFSVTFYADSDLTQVIASTSLPITGTDSPGFPVPGCARRTIMAEAIWGDLSPGLHQYWVVIDSSLQIVESDEGDNGISGFVIINPQQIFLPVVRR